MTDKDNAFKIIFKLTFVSMVLTDVTPCVIRKF